MQDIVGQVLSVQGRTTRNQKTIYDVAFSDGNTYTTFNGELATKANSLISQSVTARVEVSQNGKYTNYNLHDIAPQGQLLPLAGTPLTSGPPAPTPIPIQQGPSNGGMSPERESKIVKQSVLSTSFGFIGALFQGAGPEAIPEAIEQADSLAKQLYEKVMGAPAVTPVAQTPEAVAEVVNAAAGTEIVAVGTDTVSATSDPIPW